MYIYYVHIYKDLAREIWSSSTAYISRSFWIRMEIMSFTCHMGRRIHGYHDCLGRRIHGIQVWGGGYMVSMYV